MFAEFYDAELLAYAEARLAANAAEVAILTTRVHVLADESAMWEAVKKVLTS
jgi:hypothetical protein